MKQANEESITLQMPFDEAIERFVRINPRITEEAPIQGKACPFVKWAGGKRGIIEELVSRLPAQITRYWEPFVGGGALFFELQARIESAFLSDSNLDLTIAYNVVKRDPSALISKLEEHARKHNSDYYYKIRAQFNLQDPIDVAARFLYLNKACYNGLYRVNKKGEFNVPIGSNTNPTSAIVQRDNIMLANMALQKAQIQYREFDTITPVADDFVYFDPPYHPSGHGSFTKYTKLDFSEKDQERLREFALKLHRQGVHVMISNSDTPFIRELFQANYWHIDVVQAPRMVNCKPDGRGAVNELVVTNYNV